MLVAILNTNFMSRKSVSWTNNDYTFMSAAYTPILHPQGDNTNYGIQESSFLVSEYVKNEHSVV